MIPIVKLYKALNDRAVTGTSGYDATPLEKINEAQVQLQNTIVAYYESNQAVKDALGPFVEEITKSTVITTGLLAKESDYVHFGSVLSAAGKEAFPINTNEVSITKTSPIRKPDVSKGLIFYYQKKNNVYFLPDDVAIPVTYTYIRKPKDAGLILTPVSIADSDYLEPTGTQDLEWPESMFDLLLYMTLERLGVEMKEPILVEYAKMGINSEMINVNPQ